MDNNEMLTTIIAELKSIRAELSDTRLELKDTRTELNAKIDALDSKVEEGFKTSDAMIAIMDKKIDGLAESVDANTEAIKNMAYDNLLYRRRA